MLPMGTIVTVCMLIALLFTTRLPILKQIQNLPRALKRAVSLLVFVIGSWNVFWYALRNINEFWGQAALVSGLLMMITSFYVLDAHRLPSALNKLRPLVLLILLCFAILYAITIYQL
tara:strand:+ start:18222 stop:18572 length:351 start_codon:yes stop_codon:yes gene_type:complete